MDSTITEIFASCPASLTFGVIAHTYRAGIWGTIVQVSKTICHFGMSFTCWTSITNAGTCKKVAVGGSGSREHTKWKKIFNPPQDPHLCTSPPRCVKLKKPKLIGLHWLTSIIASTILRKSSQYCDHYDHTYKRVLLHPISDSATIFLCHQCNL